LSEEATMAGIENQNKPRSIPALTTIAMLKTYLDAGEDYLGIFRPFLMETIAEFRDPAFSAAELQLGLASAFGLTIPEPALRAMLGRLLKAGAVKREGGRFLRTMPPERGDIQRRRDEIEREHERLADAFVQFISRKGWQPRTRAQALDAIVQFLDDYRVEMLLESVPSRPGPPESTASDVRLAALFLKDVALGDAELAGLVQRLLEGLVLESTLLLRDIDSSKRDFHGLQVFLDTGFLLHALGYCGAPWKNLALETLSLLKQTNARSLVFDVTVEEIRGILAVYRDHLLTPAGRETLRPTEMTRCLLTTGWGSADIAEQMALLGSNLGKLGIQVVQLPRRQREFQQDERRLQELLARPGFGLDEPRVLHDVDVVIGVTILRAGTVAWSWEQTRAVFASLTREVVATIEQWHKEGSERGLPPVLHVARLTNIAWLKNPRVGSALKRSELMALCSAALRPSEDVWRRFLAHLRRLEASGNISSDEAAAVLVSELTDSLLSEAEVFDDVDAETIGEVIERVRDSYRAEAAQDVAQIRREVDEARRETQSLRDEIAERDRRDREVGARLSGKALAVGRVISLVVCVGLGAIVVLGVVGGLGYVPGPLSLLVRVLIGIALGVAAVLSALGMLFGTSLGNLHRALSTWLGRHFEQWWGA
jgi:hypothetical protein